MPNTNDIVDEFEVARAIRELYGLRESDMDLPGIKERVSDLEARVEQARREARLTRYARKDPYTGVVTGYCYKRPELYAFLQTQPGFRRGSAVAAAQTATQAR